MALALTLCLGPSARAQSGRARQSSQSEARARGLSGRELKPRTKVAQERGDETNEAEVLSRASDGKFDVRSLNEGRRTPVAYSLDPETITSLIIIGMIILILTSGKT